MSYAKYRLTKAFKAPKGNLKKGETLTFRQFEVGDEFIGCRYETDPALRLAPTLLASHKWAIPVSYTKKIKDMTEDEIKEDAKKSMEKIRNPESVKKSSADGVSAPTTDSKEGQKQIDDVMPEGIKKRIEDITQMSGIKGIVASSKASQTGILVGGAGGALYGLMAKKSILWWTLIGMIGGGIIGRIVANKRNDTAAKNAQTLKDKANSVPA